MFYLWLSFGIGIIQAIRICIDMVKHREFSFSELFIELMLGFVCWPFILIGYIAGIIEDKINRR